MSPETRAGGEAAAARLGRLLKPESIAVVGGEVAAEVIRRCREIGYAGSIWPVHPRRAQIEGMTAFASVDDLPGAPDAAFIAVPREQTVGVVADCARRGCGGVVCYASGFAEVDAGIDAEGTRLQRELVAAAGQMALLGPNCYGAINFLDGCALWPDHFGGARVERGVAIVTQSGNIALNLTLQRRNLPIAYMIALGNQAVTGIHDCIATLLQDERVTAIGLHLEGLADVGAFARVARAALERGVALVALKAGASTIGAQLTASHTRSLAGSDALYSALFRRLGIARVADLSEFLETLKLLHACGPLDGARVASLSCSGGDAALVADLGQAHGLRFPQPAPEVVAALARTLGPRVPINNPLDYQTYIWGDQQALTACFGAMMDAQVDLCQLVLDFPRTDGAAVPGWDEVVGGFVAAHAGRSLPAALVSSMPELMPAGVARRLLDAGIAPLQGLREAAVAIAAAAGVGRRRRERDEVRALLDVPPLPAGAAVQLDEHEAKAALAAAGLTVPAGRIVDGADEAVAAAEAIGYPVVVKAVGDQLAHKTEAGAVRLNLAGAQAVRAAVDGMRPRFVRFLVEKMITGASVELIVGVTRDPQFGLALTVGAGGVLVELLADSATLLLPVARADIGAALRGLRCFALLAGYRGGAPVDLEAVIDAIAGIAAFAQARADRLLEMDVNPLLAGAHGCTVVDALVRLAPAGAAAAPAIGP
jgi:acetyl-CoA synthetase